MRIILIKSTLAIFLGCFCFSVFSSDLLDYSQIIEEAEKIKSSEPIRYRNMVSELSAVKNKLSLHQQDRITYLEAYLEVFSGEFREAVELVEQIVEKSSDIDLLVKSNMLLVNLYIPRNEWGKGIKSLFYVIKNINKIEQKSIAEAATGVVALSFSHLEQFERAIKYINNLDLSQYNVRNRCLIGQVLIESIVNSGGVISNVDYTSAIKSCRDAGEELMVGLIKFNRAENILADHPKKAIDSLLKLDEELSASKAPYIRNSIRALLSKGYFLLGNNQKARDFALSSLSGKEELLTKRAEVSSLYTLYQVEKNQGDNEKALDYYVRYSRVYSERLNETQTKTFAFQMAELKLIEKENEIKRLNDQNALLTLKSELSETEAENSRLFMLLMAASLFLVGIFFYRAKMTQLRLKHLAEYDHLTGVFNRGHFTHQALSALKYDHETKVTASVIVFDLDFFKEVNDRFGHPTGDWALRKVAEVCQKQCRKADLFARLGGEEFCFLLMGSKKESAGQVAENCRKAIAAIDSSETGHKFKLTASFGVTDTRESGFSLEKMLADADAAMYSSKNNGRDLVSIYERDNPKDWPYRVPFLSDKEVAERFQLDPGKVGA